MVENQENAEIVRTIVTLAKTLGLDVIAEGVETREQMEHLQRLACENGQGYLFAKPLEAAAAGQIVRQMEEWQAFIPATEPVHQEAFDTVVSKYAM